MNRFSHLLVLPVLLGFPETRAQRRFNPVVEATRQFKAYQPRIEAAEHAAVDEPLAITGDLNGDGRTDVILFFVLTPKEGGNAIIGRQAAVYLSTAKGMKVDGAFPELGYCYVPEAIQKGTIRVGSYECIPPYDKRVGERHYRWKGNALVAASPPTRK